MQYLDPNQVTAVRQTAPPPNRSRTGYGSKIPTSWMLEIDGRWHRVYVVVYSNSGSAYVTVRGKDLYLGSYDPKDWQGPQNRRHSRARRRR
jgi:hypothetical protein